MGRPTPWLSSEETHQIFAENATALFVRRLVAGDREALEFYARHFTPHFQVDAAPTLVDDLQSWLGQEFTKDVPWLLDVERALSGNEHQKFVSVMRLARLFAKEWKFYPNPRDHAVLRALRERAHEDDELIAHVRAELPHQSGTHNAKVEALLGALYDVLHTERAAHVHGKEGTAIEQAVADYYCWLRSAAIDAAKRDLSGSHQRREPISAEASVETQALTVALAAERYQMVRAALTLKQQSVFDLRCKGYSPAEIAEELGITRNNVDQITDRIRKKQAKTA